jgi:pimeloyl-ACP methyl ester carboxylesterase
MPDGKWQMGSQGPVAQKHIPLELYLAFSDATKSGKRPVVIFQHGLGGSKDASWGTADRLAGISERGAAVIAIDSPEHGARAADPGANAFFAALSFFGVDQATQTFDVGRARDNFRQMASDQLELVRLIDALATLDLLPIGAPDGIPDLDVSQIYYLGHSFGSVQGPTIAALAPEIHAAVWNVGGDALMTLLRDSGTFGLLVNSLRPTGMPDGALARFFVLGQAIVDPGDPIHYARFVTREPTPGQTGWAPRDVLLQEVVEDNVVPNSTSEALARAAGLTLVNSIVDIPGLPKDKAPLTGNFPGGATGAISQFDKMDDGMPAEHGGLIFSKEARAQYVEFFKSVITKGHGTVNPPY